MKAKTLITDNRGVATSLLETVLVISIAAIISSVALVSAMGHVDDARFSRALADVQTIGMAVHRFIEDNGFAPAFKSGAARGPSDPIFLLLETDGSDPLMADSLHWPTNATDRDKIERHLKSNLPSGIGPRYPRMGEISWARFKGWNGPYVATVPSADPWDNKYLVTVQFLTPQGVAMAIESETLVPEVGQRPAAFVISAGPNRQIDTRFDQTTDNFNAGGDDIVFRIQ